MSEPTARPSPHDVAVRIGVPVARRHIFLCADATEPKCCDRERSLAAWDFLKRRLRELGLSQSGGVLRGKLNCLRICTGGPIAVVYPEGTWYAGCDPDVLESIVQRYLIGGGGTDATEPKRPRHELRLGAVAERHAELHERSGDPALRLTRCAAR